MLLATEHGQYERFARFSNRAWIEAPERAQERLRRELIVQFSNRTWIETSARYR